MPKQSSEEASPVRSAQRMLSILSWFSVEHSTGTVSDIARNLALAPSTVRRLLATLEQHKFVIHDSATRGYRLHVEVARLGSVAVSTNDVVRAASDVMDGLIKKFDETVVLSTLDDAVVVHLAIRQSLQRLSIYPPITRRYSAYEGGASGRVLFAWKPRDDVLRELPAVESWPAYESGRALSREAFLASLESVRRSGYAINDGETDPDLWAVAAPIRDHTGDVVAALSTIVRRTRLPDERKDLLTQAIVEAGRVISTALCHDDRPNARDDGR